MRISNNRKQVEAMAGPDHLLVFNIGSSSVNFDTYTLSPDQDLKAIIRIAIRDEYVPLYVKKNDKYLPINEVLNGDN